MLADHNCCRLLSVKRTLSIQLGSLKSNRFSRIGYNSGLQAYPGKILYHASLDTVTLTLAL